MGESINRLSLYFDQLKSVEVREEPVPDLKPDQVLVGALLSAISAGTELLVYRHQISPEQPLDANIRSLSGSFQYPLKYGYSTVGKVVSAGPQIAPSWIGKNVFAFHPHESFFTAGLDELIEIPEGIELLDALFLPNMETAINFVMDGLPVLGENVVVLGQGIVGLLTTSILSQFPLKNLVTLDLFPLRRRISQQLGARLSLDAGSPESLCQIKSLLREDCSSGADLTFEISGNPDALNTAIGLTGFDGRIVVGSWYGSKPVNLRLDETFHRSRIKLISSQVSTVASVFQGRWNKPRRFQTAWRLIAKVRPSQFITRQFLLTEAAEAYRILDQNPAEVVQFIFTYPSLQEDYV